MAESTDNEQDINSAPTDEQPQQPFITLPFDEEISFTSPQELLTWIKKDKEQFSFFHRNSLSYRDGSNRQEDIVEFSNDIDIYSNFPVVIIYPVVLLISKI